MRWLGAAVVALSLVPPACSRAPEARQYEVRGQILGVDAERREVLVDHEDIEGFMPAMIMPYRVRDVALLEGRQPGDLITATLVVEEASAYLSAITATGHGPIRNPSAGPAITDADLLNVGDPVPDHALVDQDGTARPLTSFRGHRVALTFMYTRCPLPDFCPLMDRNFASVQDEIRRRPDLADVRLVSVTVDPDYDVPAILERHARALGADAGRWSFLTGRPDDVLAFARRFGIHTEPDDFNSLVVHNLRTAVIDPQGRLVTVHSGSFWTPAELIADIEQTPPPAR